MPVSFCPSKSAGLLLLLDRERERERETHLAVISILSFSGH